MPDIWEAGDAGEIMGFLPRDHNDRSLIWEGIESARDGELDGEGFVTVEAYILDKDGNQQTVSYQIEVTADMTEDEFFKEFHRHNRGELSGRAALDSGEAPDSNDTVGITAIVWG